MCMLCTRLTRGEEEGQLLAHLVEVQRHLEHMEGVHRVQVYVGMPSKSSGLDLNRPPETHHTTDTHAQR